MTPTFITLESETRGKMIFNVNSIISVYKDEGGGCKIVIAPGQTIDCKNSYEQIEAVLNPKAIGGGYQVA